MRVHREQAGPAVDPGAWVAATAVLAGAATVARGASLWYGAAE